MKSGVAAERKPSTGLKQWWLLPTRKVPVVAAERKPSTGLKHEVSAQEWKLLASRGGEKTQHGIETSSGG